MKRIFTVLLVAALVFTMFGCGFKLPQETTVQTTEEQTTTVTPDIQTTAALTTSEVEETVIPVDVLEFDSLDMLFTSGAGAWATEFTLNGDGTFSGVFSDMNMGECEDDYPNGTLYISDFSGKFGDFKKLNDYTYSMELETLRTELDVGTEWIEEGIKYVVTEPHGFVPGKEFKLYTPDTPPSALTEDVAFWLRLRSGELLDTLGFYALENVTEGFGMFEVPTVTEIYSDYAALTEQLIVGVMTEEWLSDGYTFTDLDAFRFINSLVEYRDNTEHPFGLAMTLNEEEFAFCIDRAYALKLVGDVFGIADFEESQYHTTMYHAESDTYRTPYGIGLWSSKYSYEKLKITSDGQYTYAEFDLVNSKLYEYEEANFGRHTFVFDGYKLVEIR